MLAQDIQVHCMVRETMTSQLTLPMTALSTRITRSLSQDKVRPVGKSALSWQPFVLTSEALLSVSALKSPIDIGVKVADKTKTTANVSYLILLAVNIGIRMNTHRLNVRSGVFLHL